MFIFFVDKTTSLLLANHLEPGLYISNFLDVFATAPSQNLVSSLEKRFEVTANLKKESGTATEVAEKTSGTANVPVDSAMINKLTAENEKLKVGWLTIKLCI